MLVDKIKLQCYTGTFTNANNFYKYFCARCDIKCVLKLHWKLFTVLLSYIQIATVHVYFKVLSGTQGIK